MDVSKAFDIISLDFLIAKLHAYGYSKESLKLIKSYLSNRWQRTKVPSSLSTCIKLAWLKNSIREFSETY